MKILDVCCGSRMFWYDKEELHTTYMDIRNAIYTAMDRGNERRIEISPKVLVCKQEYFVCLVESQAIRSDDE